MALLRVLGHANVGPLRPGEWRDVEDSPQLRGWLSSGLAALSGPGGAPPPSGPLRRARCCGQS